MAARPCPGHLSRAVPSQPNLLTAPVLQNLLSELDALLPSAFGDRRVALVIHGGAAILLNNTMALVHHSPRRLATHAVQYLGAPFVAEWRAGGITDARDRLQWAAHEAAARVGVGPDWLTSDGDQALTQLTDASGRARYPLYEAATQLHNAEAQTLFTGNTLHVLGIPSYWAIALKLQRFVGWDIPDICLILRYASGFPWTVNIIEEWLLRNCSQHYPVELLCGAGQLEVMRDRLAYIVQVLQGQISVAHDGQPIQTTHDVLPSQPSAAYAYTIPTSGYSVESLRPYTGVHPMTAEPPVISPYPGDAAFADDPQMQGLYQSHPQFSEASDADWSPHGLNQTLRPRRDSSSDRNESSSERGEDTSRFRTMFVGQTPPLSSSNPFPRNLPRLRRSASQTSPSPLHGLPPGVRRMQRAVPESYSTSEESTPRSAGSRLSPIRLFTSIARSVTSPARSLASSISSRSSLSSLTSSARSRSLSTFSDPTQPLVSPLPTPHLASFMPSPPPVPPPARPPSAPVIPLPPPPSFAAPVIPRSPFLLTSDSQHHSALFSSHPDMPSSAPVIPQALPTAHSHQRFNTPQAAARGYGPHVPFSPSSRSAWEAFRGECPSRAYPAAAGIRVGSEPIPPLP